MGSGTRSEFRNIFAGCAGIFLLLIYSLILGLCITIGAAVLLLFFSASLIVYSFARLISLLWNASTPIRMIVGSSLGFSMSQFSRGLFQVSSSPFLKCVSGLIYKLVMLRRSIIAKTPSLPSRGSSEFTSTSRGEELARMVN